MCCGRTRWRRLSSLEAVRADPFRLNRRPREGEPHAPGGFLQRLRDAEILDLGDALAAEADQELRGVGVVMPMIRGVQPVTDAADKSGQPLDTVDKPVFNEKFEGAIHGRRRGRATQCPQLVEQFIGPRW